MAKFSKMALDHHLSFESIEFQTDSYARDLEILVSGIARELQDNPSANRGLAKHPLIKKIEDMTFKRMGLQIKLVTNSHLAAVMPFYPNPYGIFVKGHRVDEARIPVQEKILKSAETMKGSVDLQKCKVSGVFSEYVNPVYMNFKELLDYGISAAEITGILLHELGHAFYGCEYSNRLNMTNQILADLLRKTTKKQDLPREYIFKELRKINPKTTNDELDKMMDGKNIILGRKTFRFLKETIESQMPENRYNENSFETLADHFAARWGYGEQVVRGLERLYSHPLYQFRNSFIGMVVFSAASIVLIACLVFQVLQLFGFAAMVTAAGAVGAAATLSGVSFVLGVWFALILLAVVLAHSTHAVAMTYDDVKHRYKRIRNQMVELLKDSGLPGKQIVETIDTIHELDRIIESKKNWPNLVTLVVDFLTPGSGKIDDDIRVQRLLEDLSANELYVHAAALRHA